ncbi:hypothetical protein [Actinoplanes sp. NPDC049599]|uniref:hypothetical protein n=1 Tax=Actinoplanes sp. NPDC049599 TaxID=3363903 RepID=UPI0037A5BE80
MRTTRSWRETNGLARVPDEFRHPQGYLDLAVEVARRTTRVHIRSAALMAIAAEAFPPGPTC